MALRAASSIMSHSGPDGCNHTRGTTMVNGTVVADPEFVIDCGTCEPTLVDHELWGPANQSAPLTTDEQRLVEAQQADANRNVWSALAAMPGQFAELAAQNAMTNRLLASLADRLLPPAPVPGLPPLPPEATATVADAAPDAVPAAKRTQAKPRTAKG